MRESLDRYYLDMLVLVARRSTCVRREVAAIITSVEGHVLSTGYNGVPSGYAHCTDFSCDGALDEPGMTDRCMAVHAELNALIQCTQPSRAHVIYCSTAPCFNCAKVIANTAIKRVVYREPYADYRGIELLQKLGVEVWAEREVP